MDSAHPSFIQQALIGIRLPPFLVANARALVIAVALAALAGGIKYIAGYDFTVLGIPQELSVLIGPAAFYVLRAAEGLFDQQVTPHMNDTPPTTVVKGEKAGGVKHKAGGKK